MQNRLYPISRELFDKEILPIIIRETTKEERPRKKGTAVGITAFGRECGALINVVTL